MKITKNLYNEIIVCPTCKGYGVLNPKDPSYEHQSCDDCEGFGSYIDEEKGRVVFGLPLFVDYLTRNRLGKLKLVLYVFIILSILISIFVIF